MALAQTGRHHTRGWLGVKCTSLARVVTLREGRHERLALRHRAQCRLGHPDPDARRIVHFPRSVFGSDADTRDIEAAFKDATGTSLLSRTAVSQITERLWQEYEAFAVRDLSEFSVAYLFVDGVAERLHAGLPREAVLCAWGITRGRSEGLCRRTSSGLALALVPHAIPDLRLGDFLQGDAGGLLLPALDARRGAPVDLVRTLRRQHHQ
jgi:hypothetical protein